MARSGVLDLVEDAVRRISNLANKGKGLLDKLDFIFKRDRGQQVEGTGRRRRMMQP